MLLGVLSPLPSWLGVSWRKEPQVIRRKTPLKAPVSDALQPPGSRGVRAVGSVWFRCGLNPRWQCCHSSCGPAAPVPTCWPRLRKHRNDTKYKIKDNKSVAFLVKPRLVTGFELLGENYSWKNKHRLTKSPFFPFRQMIWSTNVSLPKFCQHVSWKGGYIENYTLSKPGVGSR